MILQGNLQMEFKGESYSMSVKTILKNDIYYFFVSDREKEKSLLDGETIELTYTDSFNVAEKKKLAELEKIGVDIVDSVKNMLLENKQLWFY